MTPNPAALLSHVATQIDPWPRQTGTLHCALRKESWGTAGTTKCRRFLSVLLGPSSNKPCVGGSALALPPCSSPNKNLRPKLDGRSQQEPRSYLRPALKNGSEVTMRTGWLGIQTDFSWSFPWIVSQVQF